MPSASLRSSSRACRIFPPKLSQQVVRFVQALRDQDFYKSPGVAETIDWATALTELDARSLTPQVVGDTLGALLKYQDDIARMQGDTLQKVLKEATSDVVRAR